MCAFSFMSSVFPARLWYGMTEYCSCESKLTIQRQRTVILDKKCSCWVDQWLPNTFLSGYICGSQSLGRRPLEGGGCGGIARGPRIHMRNKHCHFEFNFAPTKYGTWMIGFSSTDLYFWCFFVPNRNFFTAILEEPLPVLLPKRPSWNWSTELFSRGFHELSKCLLFDRISLACVEWRYVFCFIFTRFNRVYWEVILCFYTFGNSRLWLQAPFFSYCRWIHKLQ